MLIIAQQPTFRLEALPMEEVNSELVAQQCAATNPNRKAAKCALLKRSSSSLSSAAAASREQQFQRGSASTSLVRPRGGEQTKKDDVPDGAENGDRADEREELRESPPGGAPGADQHDEDEDEERAAEQEPVNEEFHAPLVWRNIILFIILHSALPIGVRMLWLGQVKLLTLVWSFVGIYASGLGVTGGAHRLWSHRAYKASWPVQVLLMLLQTMAGQNSIYTWSRDHRVHHKFAETNADPHNIKRGFLFAHMGWLCCRKHPDVRAKGKLIDMSDLEANRLVMFQHRHFWWLALLFTVLLPSYVPKFLWGESFWSGFVFAFMLRYLVTLHGTWLVNSAAHYFGSRPYDNRIEARESPFVIATGLGEGFHNYHHTFPYDYSTSEFGKYFNITTAFIDLCASLGLVHERRAMSKQLIDKRKQRTGAQLVAGATGARPNERLVNNLISELPYISGLFSMKYSL